MSDTYIEVQTCVEILSKPIGLYLREAGRLNDGQIRVALWDQHATGMLFGDVLLARGWVDEATLEHYLSQQHSIRLKAFLKHNSPGNILNTQQFLEMHWGDRTL
jgi:hypothetical protein